MKRVIGLALLLAPGVALPQAVPANLDFEQGEPGKVPAWWFVPQGLLNAGYSAELRREGCKSGLGCAVVLAPENGAMPFANLMQRFDAAPYRGKLVRLRAWVRLDTRAPGDRAQLWFRVDRGGGQMGFFDNMGNRPITSAEWRACEIEGEIDEDAGYINIGLMSVGKGRAWIDGLSLDVAPVSAASEAVRRQIQELYGRIDAAYERRDFDAVLRLALPDATAGFMGMKQPLRVLVDMMRARLKPDSKIASRTRVTSVEMRGDTALVSVSSDLKFSSAGEERALVNVSRDSWVRVPDGWRLKESTQVSSRPVAPPTSAEATARLAAELKRYAAPLKTVEAGNAMGDLAAFGRAVGDARIVSLGEASHGTKEFFQIKHRLLEYLVKEKGFTVFAIEANWPESLAVDRYVKSGEGDPKAALAGMYFWTWNTQEVLDMIEWMRAYNKAAGKAVLSFTSFDMQTHRVAAAQALEYLRKFLPGEAKAAEAGFGEVDKIPRGQMSAPHAAAAAEQAEKVVALFDARREALVKASSPEAWRNARQAAEIVRQAAAMRIPGGGSGSGYRDEMMARNVQWLAGEVHPKEKIVLWAHNGHVRRAEEYGVKWMGNWLAERYGKQMYVLGFAFRRGEVRAVGMEKGRGAGLRNHVVPPSPEGTGDAVFSAAGMPIFFLDMKSLPAESGLARWLLQPHRFRSLGAIWMIGDPEANFSLEAMAKGYDGLIFIEEGHAAAGLPMAGR